MRWVLGPFPTVLLLLDHRQHRVTKGHGLNHLLAKTNRLNALQVNQHNEQHTAINDPRHVPLSIWHVAEERNEQYCLQTLTYMHARWVN